MKKIKFSLVLFFCFLNAVNTFAQSKKTPLHFIYIHGFGERRLPPAFEKRAKVFIAENKLNASIETFYWDSKKLNPFIVLTQWRQAKNNIPLASMSFCSKILTKYESLKEPYVLICYSLGCRVISQSLAVYPKQLEYLQGIYFLGAAIDSDVKMNLKPLPNGVKIKNFHSIFDYALSVSYWAMEGKDAAGSKGFLDSRVENFRTASTHVYKGGPLKRDYSELYLPILSLELLKYGEKIPSGELLINWELSVGDGKYHWNDIYEKAVKNEKYLIQMNNNTDLFRLVWIDKEGKRIRKGWSKNILPLLELIDNLQKK